MNATYTNNTSNKSQRNTDFLMIIKNSVSLESTTFGNDSLYKPCEVTMLTMI